MAGDKRDNYENKKRHKTRKLRQNNLANGGLSPKIKEVIRHYFENGFHQDQAMISAGYAASTAKNATHMIFGRPDVKREIERQQQELHRKFEVNEEWVIRRLMILADGSTGQILKKLRENEYDLNCLNDEELYFLNEFTEEVEYESSDKDSEVKRVKLPVYGKLKVKGSDRHAALQMIARKLGLFKDQVEVTGLGSIVERLQAGRNRAAARNKKE